MATIEVDTSLNILSPNYSIIYTPPYVTGTYVPAPLFVSISGDGIIPNSSGVRDNGIYTFAFYRGTGPFTTGAGYSSGNTRSLLKTTQTINRIDNIPPTFAGVAEGVTYSSPVTITFSDNFPGVTATLNGNPFANGSTISTNGTYQLIVTDAAGNRTGATFIIFLSGPPSGGGGGTFLSQDNCLLPTSILACANNEGVDYSLNYYDGTCCPSIEEPVTIGTRILTENICKNRSCYSSYYDSICGICTPTTETDLPIYRPPVYYATPDAPYIRGSSYPQEWIEVYQRAYRLGITTIPNIDDASLDGMLYRNVASKMFSEFAIKVIGMVPDTTRECIFNDIKSQIPEFQYYIQLSCQLGIMGLDYYGNPDTVFNPHHFVTRDQLVTILSRILFGENYNLEPEELSFFDKTRNFAIHTIRNISKALRLNIDIYAPLNWYTKHLEAIRKLGLFPDYHIDTKEIKIFAMTIMYKIDQIGFKNIQEMSK